MVGKSVAGTVDWVLRFLFSTLIPPVLHIYSCISQGTDNGPNGSRCSRKCCLTCISEERNSLTEPPRGQQTLKRQWILAHTFAALWEYVLVFVLYTQGVHLPPGTVFQQAGAPPHYSHIVRNHLNYMLPGGWISIRTPIAWPTSSPDSIGYFLMWDYLEPCLSSDKQWH
jgi:hypothetical protein